MCIFEFLWTPVYLSTDSASLPTALPTGLQPRPLRHDKDDISTIHMSATTGKKASRTMHDPAKHHNPVTTLPIALGHTLQLILLLDGVGVAASLGGVDQLFGETFGNGLDVSEGSLTSADGQEGDRLVDTAKRRNIDSLSSDGTSASDSGAVFTWSAVDDSVDGHLDRVLVGHDVNLCTNCKNLFSDNPCHKSRNLQSQKRGRQF